MRQKIVSMYDKILSVNEGLSFMVGHLLPDFVFDFVWVYMYLDKPEIDTEIRSFSIRTRES